jgi:O-antigen/teichoic acid export membrane protein
VSQMNIAKIKPWIARSSIMSIAPAVEFGSRFARTVILSRFLARDEFGVAVAITVMLGIASLVTDVAIDKFAVIEADESGNEALAAAHMLSLIRGVVVTLILVAGAPAMAALFGVPQFSESFAFAALVPFIASFAHLGIKQVQRHYDYAPETLTILVSNLAAIFALVIAVRILGDHRAIIVSFLVEAVSFVLASHLLARTRYRLRANRDLSRKALSFGIPLMFNGIGLALMSQFDRALVGHWFGVDMLAKYSVLLSIAVVPVGLVLRVFGTMSLSFILSNISKGSLASDQYGFLVFLFAVLAVLYSFFVALTLDWATPLIFGRSFDVTLSVHLLLTAIVFLRLQRAGAPTNLLLATGRTRELALLNLSGGLGLALALAFLYWSARFETLLLGLVCGDMLSFLLFFFASSIVVSKNRSFLAIDLAMAFGVLAIILGTLAYDPDVSLVARTSLFGVGAIGIVLQVVVGLRIHRRLLR